MKRKLAAILIVCMLVTSLTGCASVTKQITKNLSDAITEQLDIPEDVDDVLNDVNTLKEDMGSVVDDLKNMQNATDSGTKVNLNDIQRDVSVAADDVENAVGDVGIVVNNAGEAINQAQETLKGINGIAGEISSVKDFNDIKNVIERLGDLIKSFGADARQVDYYADLLKVACDAVDAAMQGNTDDLLAAARILLPELIPGIRESVPALFDDAQKEEPAAEESAADQTDADGSAADEASASADAAAAEGKADTEKNGESGTSADAAGSGAADPKNADNSGAAEAAKEAGESRPAKALKEILKANNDIENLEEMVEESIKSARAVNPSVYTNPVGSIEELYQYLDAIPEEGLDVDYLYFLFDQKIETLTRVNQIYPVLEYYLPVHDWLEDTVEYWQEVRKPSGFQQHLPKDNATDSQCMAPADLIPSDPESGSAGTVEHMYLANDSSSPMKLYFPMEGTIVSVSQPDSRAKMPLSIWNDEIREYTLDGSLEGYEIVMDTVEYGKVTMQFTDTAHRYVFEINPKLKKGARVKQGDEIGSFLYGGNDMTLQFEKDLEIEMTIQPMGDVYLPVLVGESLLTIRKPEFSDQDTGFVKLADKCPDVMTELRYAGNNNITGKKLDSYQNAEAMLTDGAAEMLKKASVALKAKGYRIKLFDAYHPVTADEEIMKWLDGTDNKQKDLFYPKMDKKELAQKGYLKAHSDNSRGSSVDITLLDQTGRELDMGSTFGCFCDAAAPDYTGTLTVAQIANRKLLKETMEKFGFKQSKDFWWHFTLEEEPHKNTYFTFAFK